MEALVYIYIYIYMHQFCLFAAGRVLRAAPVKFSGAVSGVLQ